MLHESRAKLKIYISNIKINEIDAYTDVSVYPNKRIPTRVQIEIFIIYRYLKTISITTISITICVFLIRPIIILYD